MALSFDDHILGEKVDNYCSSSEEEEESDDDDKSICDSLPNPKTPAPDFSGPKSARTGPKGVIEDYNIYQLTKAQNQKEKEAAILELANKCSLTCRPYSTDVKAEEEELQLEEFLETLNDDAFLNEYRQKRMVEMQSNLRDLPVYSLVYELDASVFVHEIDKEPPLVTVLIHIYENGVPACLSANECMKVLCVAYPHTKFCRLRASSAYMSQNFSKKGVPAILAYKNGELIGNLISISKELGDTFSPEEFETYLYEYGLLPPQELPTLGKPTVRIRSSSLDRDLD